MIIWPVFYPIGCTSFLSVKPRGTKCTFLGVLFRWKVGSFVRKGIHRFRNGWVSINSSDWPGECLYSCLVDVIPGKMNSLLLVGEFPVE